MTHEAKHGEETTLARERAGAAAADRASGAPAAAEPSPSPAAPRPSPWACAPYRLLLGSWLGANVCMSMHEATSAWLMASLGASALVVALLQSAASLPSFLLALPSGALTDLADRRRILVVAHALMSVVGLALGAALLAGFASPGILLAGAFAVGVTLALRLPAHSALVQEVLPRASLPRAVVWNGATMNAARTVGPLIAGVIIASAGPAFAFLAMGLAMLVFTVVLARWPRPRAPASTLPSERFVGAMRVGLQFARETPAVRAAIIRGSCYFLAAVALVALLPVVVRDRLAAGPNTFTLLFGLFGLGAVTLAFTVGALRQRLSRDGMIAMGITLQTGATLAFALSTNVVVLAAAMVASGFAWISVAASLGITAQLALPAWVRGRGLAAVQMAYMGGGTFGALLWGQIATTWNLQIAFLAAAVATAASFVLARRYPVSTLREENLTPSRHWREPEVAMPVEHDEGPVQVMIEFLIDPKDADAFVELMQASRRSRLRAGASSWALFRDPANPGRYVEQWVEESWLELLRHRDKFTESERELRDAKRAFHVGPEPPVRIVLVAEDFARRKPDQGSTTV
ncbi:MAG: MFS transporter [Bacteroidota bacterium]